MLTGGDDGDLPVRGGAVAATSETASVLVMAEAITNG
jgi:hypothetical protein